MVFLDSFAMSIPKARQGPSPPTVEQILEDLVAASDEDVVFKSPVHVVVERETQTRNASGHSREEKVLQQTVGGKEVTDDKLNTGETTMKGHSNEQLYDKVASFLEQFKSLETAQEELNSLEGDLNSKKEGLEEAISRVKEAWNVDKNDG